MAGVPSVTGRDMFLSAYDKRRTISMSLHVGGPLTADELEQAVALIHGTAADSSTRDKPASVLVIVETDNTLNAGQRKALADAAGRIEWGYQAVVTRSVLARAVMTAFAWLKPSTRRFQQATYASYEEARDWLVKNVHHPPEVFDALHSELRRRAETGSDHALTLRAPDSLEDVTVDDHVLRDTDVDEAAPSQGTEGN